ncbi:probable anion transporter 6, chloroplastic [Arachis stenosperma]|uniref:probable anion transporter 6, chloroplastic n=1 Tax=Arachis stenosperma TaxID=217475 RepID=UPI0025ABAA41|nr:probable anion transporter 6, chloroplastic [Arachis stenosperma]
MEKFTLRPHTSTCFLPLPITRTSHHLLRFQFYPSPSTPTLRLRPRPRVAVASSSSSSSSKSKVLNGVRVDNVAGRQQEQQAPPVSASEDVSKIVGIWPPWKNIPQRYKLIGTTSLAFVICNMDKVNLSIAIIPMSHQFGWNSSMAGLVQSSFFWGYALSQLPGGWLAKTFGGRKVLEVGVLVWSVATAFVPLVAGYMPGLLLSRILVGIGEGVSPSAATDLIARSIPLEERSRAVAFVFGGLSVGSVMGLLLAPPLIQSLGWESVFYLFGFLGVAWFLGFQVLDGGEAQLNAGSLSFTGVQGTMTQSWKSSLKELNSSLKDVPWKSFFRSPAVWAMIYAHFCGSWGHYTCLSWLPTYFSEELNLNLTEAAWVSILPPLASVFATNIAAQLADNLIARGVETTTVRKICQSIAFLSPAICMTLSSLDLGLPPWEIVSILTGGLALSSFALSGLYCTHQDMSPEYASILLGITNTVGAIPGIVGVALTGYLLDSTHSWSISLFVPSIFFYLTGTFIWLAFASSKPQSFSEEN